MEVPNSFSTPIKGDLEKNHVNHSVDDLLQAINNNLSTSSVNLLADEDNVDTLYFNISDDNPITPLKVKHSAMRDHHSEEHVYSKSLPGSPFEEGLIQDIPRAPSFDELEFNTRLNRESSLSRVGGPRQLSNSTLSRTLSNKMGRSTSFKSAGYSSRDNSPSKRSVCFDESPPKIVEYDELTPQNSDESYEDEEVLESQWDGKLKSHVLPPPPPKHQIVASPPTKDTTLISSDDDSQDFNLTKEDLVNNSITLEQKLDLVLGSDEISRKVQEDEVSRGSRSPVRYMARNEEEFILNIKSKAELAEEQSLRDASELFEADLMNNDKESNVLRLDPALKRRNSNSSLRDEDKVLITQTVSKSIAPIVLLDGLKNADIDKLPQNDDLISVTESVQDSFASVTDIFESEPISIKEKSIPSHESQNSISTIEKTSVDFEKTHKKKLSLSESINSFISSFTKSPRKSPVKEEIEDFEIPGDFPIELHSTDVQEENDVEAKQVEQARLEKPMQLPADKVVGEVASEADCPEEFSQLIGTPAPVEEVLTTGLGAAVASLKDIELTCPTESPEDIGQTEEQFLLEHASPAVEHAKHNTSIDSFILEKPPLLGELEETSFSDEFKETMLYNTSDSMDASYISTPLALVRQIDILDELEDDGLNDSAVEVESFVHSKNKLVPLVAVEDDEAYVLHEQEVVHDQESQKPDATEATNNCELTKPVSADPGITQKEPSTLVPPLDEFFPIEEVSRSVLEPAVSVEQSQPVHVKEVAVQTEDIEEYRSLRPSSVQVETKAQFPLPSFDSTLFHDKPPKDDNVVSPPTSYIEIWHSQPKPVSPDPQYSLNGRKLSPPANVLKVLSTRRNKHEYIFDTTEDEVEIKEENLSRRASLEVARSFIATSISRSSFINVDSKKSSLILDSSFNADTSEIALPDVSQSSDFGAAFQDWIVPSEPETKLKKIKGSDNKIRAIWGSHDAQVPYEAKSIVSSGAAGQIERLIAGSELINVHFKSSDALGEVVVTENEDLGLVIEFDHDSEYDISDYKIKSSAPSPKLVGTLPKKADLVGIKAPQVIKFGPVIDIPGANVSNSKGRFISGGSEDSGFDLKDDFDKAIQLQNHSYVAHEHRDIILATSETNDGKIVEEDNLSAPEPITLKYGKTRSKSGPTAASRSPAKARVRTPLASMTDSSLNQLPQRNSSVVVGTDFSSKLNKNDASEHKVKKHSSRESITHAESVVKLPANDKGRLYIHINSLNEVMLKHIKNHKATFKLYLDNGKHTISTPKMELNSKVDVDKEFEVAVDELSTELFFTLKVSYQRPETELVDVHEKVPLSNNRLSRLLGLKPKYRVEKKYETRKKTHDDWDNIFATDGSFGKNKIIFYSENNEITARSRNYDIDLFNEWETQVRNGKEYRKAPYLIGKLDVSMLYLPRSSPLENLPPSIRIAETIANYISGQANIKFEGFLFQYGGDCELWKRRFFTVCGTNMVAHTEDTKKPRAQVNLLKVVDVLHNGKKKVQNQRNATDDILMNDGFKLKFKNGEIINFNAETKELKRQWIEVLERIVELNKFHQPWVKKLVANKE
jgi:hypothetical protein